MFRHGSSRALSKLHLPATRNPNAFTLLAIRIHLQMNATTKFPGSSTDFLSNRLFGLTRRIEEIDPQLSRVLVPWGVRHPRYLPGFLRLARTIQQSRRVRARELAGGVRVPPFLVS